MHARRRGPGAGPRPLRESHTAAWTGGRSPAPLGPGGNAPPPPAATPSSAWGRVMAGAESGAHAGRESPPSSFAGEDPGIFKTLQPPNCHLPRTPYTLVFTPVSGDPPRARRAGAWGRVTGSAGATRPGALCWRVPGGICPLRGHHGSGAPARPWPPSLAWHLRADLRVGPLLPLNTRGETVHCLTVQVGPRPAIPGSTCATCRALHWDGPGRHLALSPLVSLPPADAAPRHLVDQPLPMSGLHPSLDH